MTSHSMSSDTPEAKLADGFTAGALHGALPMIIWAAHFFVAYASAEVACALQLHRFKPLGLSAPSLWLWAITAAAIAMLMVLTVRAVRNRRAAAESGATQATVQIGAAVLALVGVLWSAVPIALVYGAMFCRTT